MIAQKDTGAIFLFLVLVILLSGIFWTLVIGAGHVGAGGGRYVEGLMWCPALAAFLTVAIRRLDVSSLGLSSFGGKYAVLAYLTPLIYAAIAYTLIWALGFGSFPNPLAIAKLSERLGWQIGNEAVFIALYFLLMATTGMVGATAHALGEEIGWRGFLAPRMVAQMGFTNGAIVTGIIWTAWHAPILLFADYNGGTQWWFALPCFAVMVVSISVMLTWIRLRSNSVWPCAILHASHNLFIQAIFDRMTAPVGRVLYVTTEFGAGLVLTTGACALYLWTRRNELAKTG